MVKWTKKCDAGQDCVGVGTIGAAKPYFVADDETFCDQCLLIRYMGNRNAWGTYDSEDRECIGPTLHREEHVVKALRLAEKGEPHGGMG